MAMLTKIHHALIDGMSGGGDHGRAARPRAPRAGSCPEPDGIRRRARPGDLEMLGRGLLGLPRYPLRALRSLPSAIPNIDGHAVRDAPRRRDRSGASPAAHSRSCSAATAPACGRTAHSAPKTTFNGRVSPHRRFVFGRLSLDDVKAVKNATAAPSTT